MGIEETRWQVGNWIQMAKDRVLWPALVSVAMYLLSHKEDMEFLDKRSDVGF
jgi:hypothetical protein